MRELVFDPYMLLKLACIEHSKTMIDLQSYLTPANNTKSTECSNNNILQAFEPDTMQLNVINYALHMSYM